MKIELAKTEKNTFYWDRRDRHEWPCTHNEKNGL